MQCCVGDRQECPDRKQFFTESTGCLFRHFTLTLPDLRAGILGSSSQAVNEYKGHAPQNTTDKFFHFLFFSAVAGLYGE
jgi:hypothetical protein